MTMTINCDMGEGFGLYRLGNDTAMMPLIDLANVACGFHASDPSIMHATVRLAKQHGVKVGAHPSLPDMQGFGRRAMTISPSEVEDLVIYQVGALKAFLQAEGLALNHVKPHGALYGMAARDENIAAAIADAVAPFGVPILGMAFTAHETVYKQKGVEMIPEFYADLEYDGDGNLILEPGARRRGSRAGRGQGLAGDPRTRRQNDCRTRHSRASDHGLCPFRYARGGRYRRRVGARSSPGSCRARVNTAERRNVR